VVLLDKKEDHIKVEVAKNKGKMMFKLFEMDFDTGVIGDEYDDHNF
jgi:hypothetical protein